MTRQVFAALLLLGLAGCGQSSHEAPAEPRSWSADDARLFPAEGGLTHAEDGVVLPDGTLLVGDFQHGLIAIAADGTTRPFGDFAAAGYQPPPSPDRAGPNGIAFEPDGRHVLVADIFTGAIYRVDTATADVVRIYDHPYGVNAAIRDSSGAIWFTQSTRNPPGANSEERMFAAVFSRMGDGAVFRIAPDQIGQASPIAEPKLEGLDFANGIAIDERRGELYVNELLGNRIMGLPVDVTAGELGTPRTVAEVTTPDNIEMDHDGNLWVVSPIANQVVKVDPETGKTWPVFAPTADASAALATEWRRLLDAGQSPQSLLGPAMHGPLPGIITGVILPLDGGAVYVTGLGPALVRLDP